MAKKESISYEEFERRARQMFDLSPDTLQDLYPLVKDLLAVAESLNERYPELHQEIELEDLSLTATGV
jgi:hypothetical protein